MKLIGYVKSGLLFLTFAIASSGLTRAATVPLDSKFGERGILRLPLLQFGPNSWFLSPVGMGQISAYSNYGLRPELGAYDSRFAALGLINNASGNLATSFGAQGVMSDLTQLKCLGEPAVTRATDGSIYLFASGGVGSFCNGGAVLLHRLGARGESLGFATDKLNGAQGIANATPGIAPMGDGRVLLAFVEPTVLGGVAEIKVVFMAIGEEESEITHEWFPNLTPISTLPSSARTKVIIRETPKGGFVVALVAQGEMKWFRLNKTGKPSDEWGVNMPASGLRPSFQNQPRNLLDMVVTNNGDFAAAVEEEGSLVDVHRVFEVAKGIVNSGKSQVKLPLNSNLVGGLTQLGEFIGATEQGGAISLHSQSGFAEAKSWTWTPPKEIFSKSVEKVSIASIAVSPNERSAVLSMSVFDSPTSFTRFDAIIAKFDFSKAVQSVAANEFFNTALNHYFFTASSAEAAGISAGAAGPGWQSTLRSFKVFENAQTAPANAAPVCRFYGTPGKGPNSHFYTFEGAECEAVKKDPGWLYEGTAFYAIKPTASGCEANNLPVYRVYNNRFAQNDSNHRYVTDLALLAVMPGWTLEGVVFCSPTLL